MSKKFKTEVIKEQEVQELLSTYKELKIAIWHGDTFLQEENSETQDMILKVLRNCGEVKITGHHLKRRSLDLKGKTSLFEYEPF